jgi:serine phosphatase RsbU (regulator of sigma subunit)
MESSDSEPRHARESSGDAIGKPRSGAGPRASRSPLLLPAVTMIVGLAVTAALALVSHSQYTNNQKRLLGLRVRDAGALVTEAAPSIQTPLASASELADVTGGNARRFAHFAAAYVGAAPRKQFASMSVWKLGSPQLGPVAVAGVAPKLARSPATAAALFARAAKTPGLDVTGLLSLPDPRIGYAVVAPGFSGAYVAYGESPLPASRRSRLQSSSQFAGLHYAIYLGAGTQTSNLLVTDVSRPPPPGVRRQVVVPYGNAQFTLVMSTQHSLAGSLPQELPWIITVAGVLLTAIATAMTILLLKRRRDAEQLAGELDVIARENQALYAQQRGIAQTLQHALLPDRLPQVPGVETSARYEAGEAGVDIGGDWYDVIDLDDGRLLLVVGDVSGKGLRAATTMALLRYAIHAYAAQHDDPEVILNKLSYLVSTGDSGQLATILFALIDVSQREISLTSAGHLPPLLIQNGDGRFVQPEIGLPIGVEAGSSYRSTKLTAPPAATLLAFTDGLVEHRGEDLDESLARLRRAAVGQHASLPDLLGRLMDELQSGAAADDIAVLGLRWTS